LEGLFYEVESLVDFPAEVVPLAPGTSVLVLGPLAPSAGLLLEPELL
jgi:hypothetical protein